MSKQYNTGNAFLPKQNQRPPRPRACVKREYTNAPAKGSNYYSRTYDEFDDIEPEIVPPSGTPLH